MNFLLGRPIFRCELLVSGGVLYIPWKILANVFLGYIHTKHDMRFIRNSTEGWWKLTSLDQIWETETSVGILKGCVAGYTTNEASKRPVASQLPSKWYSRNIYIYIKSLCQCLSPFLLVFFQRFCLETKDFVAQFDTLQKLQLQMKGNNYYNHANNGNI